MSLLLVGGAASASATENVPVEELGGDQCFKFSELLPHKTEGNRTIDVPLRVIINDEPDYRKLFDPKIRIGCDDAAVKALMNVDLSRKTVLGSWGIGGCDDIFKRRVLRDDRNKKIIYAVTVVPGPSPACMREVRESLNLVAIPKIPPGYQVVFENIRE